MPKKKDDLVQDTLFALERLMKMFAMERMLYLLCSVVSFVLLLICLWSLIDTQQVQVPHLAAIFGASGMIAASAARVSYFLNRSFDLVASIIQHLVALEEGEDRG
jgi:hypothetical protein